VVLDSPALGICVMHVDTSGEVSLLLQVMKTQDTDTQFLTSKYLHTISWQNYINQL